MWHRLWACVSMTIVVSMTANGAGAQSATSLFDRGVSFPAFLSHVAAQRETWQATVAAVTVPDRFVAEIGPRARGLTMLVVAEDWCPDSVNVVPYAAALAERSGIPLRIVDREAGAEVIRQHPTPDGRPSTPTIVLLRNGHDAGAWVERPAIVQRWFLSMAHSADDASRFANRQSWYDADRGQTTLAELTALIVKSVGP